ncbi:acyl-CoA dehydrogenase family protein [Acrocarpospora macrocephala]|uniref:Acyl-CoA dehydrogenase n=1 Tax=Acrocarpospora macrocephala TaxID=150177 RepID=A0A5M3WLW2_9ACTN|nr:acyl-CoA dehydrogenase family protein [Acrocarpospora macrocephala]GES09480.1 acyl-CoA dehydrogenase [Acrocarpospora macrocephala]
MSRTSVDVVITAEQVAVAGPTEHPAYREFAQLVDEVIAPRAVEVDGTEVPRSHIEALREVGYFSWTVPREYGGAPIPPAVKSAVDDLLFGADPSTALAVVHHGSPVTQALSARTPPAMALLPKLATGERIGGAGMSQIRAWPKRPSLMATRAPGGYRFDGAVRWISGWGLVDTAWIGAIDEQNSTYVFGIADLTRPGITATRLRLAAVQGSRTASLKLDRYFVPDEFVTQVVDIAEWNRTDGQVWPNARQAQAPAAQVPELPTAGPVGLGRAALADALAAYPGQPSLLRLSEELERAAVTPITEPHWRVQLDALAVRATAAGLIASGGEGLLTDNIAQVRARAALFLQVRALSERVRPARLEQFAN